MAKPTRDPPLPTGSAARMNSADPATQRTVRQVQEGDTTRNPDAKVPSDLYPDPPGVTERTRGAPDD